MEVVGVAAPPFLPPSPSFATVAKGDTQWNGSHSDRCGAHSLSCEGVGLRAHLGVAPSGHSFKGERKNL